MTDRRVWLAETAITIMAAAVAIAVIYAVAFAAFAFGALLYNTVMFIVAP